MYLPSYSFTDSFTFHERTIFCEEYSDEKWRQAINNLHSTKRCVISKSAIKIAKVIKHKLDIDLFPLIIPVAMKGYSISDGTFAFEMMDSNGDEYNFEDRASRCKSMNGEYYLRRMFNDRVIGRNK
jgi:hypothetical protein